MKYYSSSEISLNFHLFSAATFSFKQRDYTLQELGGTTDTSVKLDRTLGSGEAATSIDVGK